ncbi:serpentine type 7TM GPCR chemoreceptor srv domain-containing protein [Ditylenchus destructor]|uniref:Serpentine type 7TM GPCR chemoreceptor srv domain-containing protein n=1 Tax=Ditylenchus destructor TaxID=166010 RepID=A0AAD4QX59_9BILA|nr:serpentine type 7TM GPCR chemoreceptor srv domain-containing protein [Ditylenchus destructor]
MLLYSRTTLTPEQPNLTADGAGHTDTDEGILMAIYIALRIPSCGYFPTLYLNNHWLAWLTYSSITYIEFYQLFGHTLISMNRFTVLVLPPKYNRIWTGKALCGWLFLNAILPLPFTAVRFRVNIRGEGYVQLSDGTFGLAPLKVDGTEESVTIGVFTCFAVIATLTAFVLELLVVIKIRHHLLSQKQTSTPLKNDIKLLFSSIVVFCAQLLQTLYYVVFLYSVLSDTYYKTFAQDQYIWISDVISLCGSFALFTISDTVRCNYLEFYGITTALSKLQIMDRKCRKINRSTLPAKQ